MVPPLTSVDRHGHQHKEGWDKRQKTAQPLCRNSQCPVPTGSPDFSPATKAVMDETRGPRPGADSEGMQDRTRRPTDATPHRTARMLKVCVTWM